MLYESLIYRVFEPEKCCTLFRKTLYADEVEGRRYESERIRFGTFRESEKEVRAILDRYPVGASVQVRYDPADPSAATLETKTINIGLQLFAVIALLGLALYLAVMLLT